jgi:hypothetical protein
VGFLHFTARDPELATFIGAGKGAHAALSAVSEVPRLSFGGFDQHAGMVGVEAIGADGAALRVLVQLHRFFFTHRHRFVAAFDGYSLQGAGDDRTIPVLGTLFDDPGGSGSAGDIVGLAAGDRRALLALCLLLGEIAASLAKDIARQGKASQQDEHR